VIPTILFREKVELAVQKATVNPLSRCLIYSSGRSRLGPSVRDKGLILMEKPLIVVKLGGSVLTDKKRIFTPRLREIRRAAKQVSALAKRYSVALVHGAGSFGHIPVKKWGLESGFKNRTQLRGLVATKARLLEWELIFDSVFLKNQVPLVPLPASDFVVARNGRISAADLRPLRNWLRIGCIPSTGGDMVTDLEEGFSVVSGDQLAAYLAIKLKASRLVFGTDVDGIFEDDPKLNPHARILRELTISSALRVAGRPNMSTAPDVTGRMAGKIVEAVAAASHGIPVFFVNLTADNRLEKIGFDQDAICSKILPK
jgi:isopentenyl phosphate kinase